MVHTTSYKGTHLIPPRASVLARSIIHSFNAPLTLTCLETDSSDRLPVHLLDCFPFHVLSARYGGTAAGGFVPVADWKVGGGGRNNWMYV